MCVFRGSLERRETRQNPANQEKVASQPGVAKESRREGGAVGWGAGPVLYEEEDGPHGSNKDRPQPAMEPGKGKKREAGKGETMKTCPKQQVETNQELTLLARYLWQDRPPRLGFRRPGVMITNGSSKMEAIPARLGARTPVSLMDGLDSNWLVPLMFVWTHVPHEQWEPGQACRGGKQGQVSRTG